jgi:ankyrin repeat protein
VKLLLEFGANPNQIDDEDDPPPPLWWAAFNRDLGIAQVLIDNGAKAEGVGGRSPLMEASRNGDMEMVKLLIGKGAHVNSRNAHGTPLSSAAAADKIDAIQFLIEKGADLEGKDLGMAWTPLMRAASEGSMKAVKLLLEKGADSGVRDYTGASPASIAMQHNHRDVAELLASYDSKGRSHPKSANK